MIRPTLAVCALAVLGACSSGGTSPVISIIKDTVLPPKSDEEAVERTGNTTLTRETIESYGIALIRARIDGEDVSNLLSGTSLNDRYVTFVSAFRQTITMLGSLVTSTRGLGGDLLSVAHGTNDPVASLIPVADWPSAVSRDYRFPDVGPEGRVVSVQCSISFGPEATLNIVEVDYAVTMISEVCEGSGEAFTNTYWVETTTGQIWQSSQWVGPKVGYLNVEVLEPITFD